ncbi:MAG: hypothetical protein M3O31_04570 [Acidobacteriota bacterium]|nr:hypothetical protein [Acidobacteriota bacterium]
MFLRKLTIERIDASGACPLCPIAHLDNFAMRNFTNKAIFDDTFPSPPDCSKPATASLSADPPTPWKAGFRRKSYLTPTDHLHITELPR